MCALWYCIHGVNKFKWLQIVSHTRTSITTTTTTTTNRIFSSIFISIYTFHFFFLQWSTSHQPLADCYACTLYIYIHVDGYDILLFIFHMYVYVCVVFLFSFFTALLSGFLARRQDWRPFGSAERQSVHLNDKQILTTPLSQSSVISFVLVGWLSMFYKLYTMLFAPDIIECALVLIVGCPSVCTVCIYIHVLCIPHLLQQQFHYGNNIARAVWRSSSY